MEMYARVRRACMVEGMSVREAAREFGLHRDTVRKMLKYSVPPGYRRRKPVSRPKLEPYIGVIEGILEGDRGAPKKQRHTAKRIFERLRAEYGFTPGYGISELWKATQRMASRPDFEKLVDCPLTTSHASASVRYDEVEETDGNSPGGQETRYHPDRRRACWQSGLWAA